MRKWLGGQQTTVLKKRPADMKLTPNTSFIDLFSGYRFQKQDMYWVVSEIFWLICGTRLARLQLLGTKIHKPLRNGLTTSKTGSTKVRKRRNWLLIRLPILKKDTATARVYIIKKKKKKKKSG